MTRIPRVCVHVYVQRSSLGRTLSQSTICMDVLWIYVAVDTLFYVESMSAWDVRRTVAFRPNDVIGT